MTLDYRDMLKRYVRYGNHSSCGCYDYDPDEERVHFSEQEWAEIAAIRAEIEAESLAAYQARQAARAEQEAAAAASLTKFLDSVVANAERTGLLPPPANS